MEAIATREEAIPTTVEAMASMLEPTRVEAHHPEASCSLTASCIGWFASGLEGSGGSVFQKQSPRVKQWWQCCRAAS